MPPQDTPQNTIDIQTLPVLPLKNTVLFPSLVMPLTARRAISIAAAEASLQSEEKSIFLVAQRDAAIEAPHAEDLYSIGTLATIRKAMRAEDGRVTLIALGVQRASLLRIEQQEPYLKAKIHILPTPSNGGDEVEALRRSILDFTGQILKFNQPTLNVDIHQLEQQAESPLQLAYLLASTLGLETGKEQSILEANTLIEVLRTLYGYLLNEVRIIELRQKIANQAQGEMSRQQREYILRQQLRAIQEELGEAGPKISEISELRKKMSELNLPEHVHKEVEHELNRLEQIPTTSPDYQVIRGYLDFIFDLPWNKSSPATINLTMAREVLNNDHYDLQDIKNRILEHLAVLILNPQAKAPIICLVGPPGVGKTSLGQSIARALNRKFERMSLGGLHDEAELRGHRRTYVGAIPGRILQAIRRAGVNNPLLMLDEVDKLGSDFRGDPAAALLEILDPAQNHSFHDNYLDLAFDLSRVFFITTANTLDTIPGPLLDRMETLRLSGYTEEEKLEIARRYLIPRQMAESGLKKELFQLPDETLMHIIRRYTREAGVRELERVIGRAASKVALEFAEGRTQPWTVTLEQLGKLLGPEKFYIELARQTLPPGVATGLAWTPAGGEILYIEASLIPGNKELRLTGHLGDIMQESAKAAQTYIQAHASQWGLPSSKAQETGIHIHIPAGAIPKDGPSAGIAIVAAMASAFLQIPCRTDTAMTGEITLSGLILPVGGIKEKLLAARRAGIFRVILPKDNAKDLLELSEQARKEMNLELVDRIELALNLVLPGLPGTEKPKLSSVG